MNWNAIATYLISATTLTAAIIYIGKRIVDKSLDLALENYRGKLTLELETHKIKFGRLHPDRLEAIRLFQSKLYDLEKALCHLTTTWQGPEWTRDKEREDYANGELIALKALLEINQIYFNDKVCTRIDEIYSEGKKILYEMAKIKIDEQVIQTKLKSKFQLPMEEVVAPSHRWIDLEREVQEKIQIARAEMTREFRTLIGVE